MPFTIRKFRRLPVHGSVIYHRGMAEGQGTVRNISLTGARLSGDFPLHLGETCSYAISLPHQQSVYVAAGIVRWKRGNEFGVESLVVDADSREEINRIISWRIDDHTVYVQVPTDKV